MVFPSFFTLNELRREKGLSEAMQAGKSSRQKKNGIEGNCVPLIGDIMGKAENCES
jgi:hypothetical protein